MKLSLGTAVLCGCLLLGTYLWYFIKTATPEPPFVFIPRQGLQSTSASCGAAALALYLAVQGLPVSEKMIIDTLGQDAWLSFADMQNYVQQHHFKSRGLFTPPEVFIKNNFLSILQVHNDHFVVFLAALPEEHALLYDPAVGYVRLTLKQVARQMTGNIFYATKK